ncbi:MAG: hypothetical protein J1F24_01605 [Oscillospiraceae bacterium]|nr:hypothetical protein [Oscillospiraceae bacterium]
MKRNNRRKPSNKGKFVLYQMASFALTIAILGIIGAIIPLRPKESISEKRKLSEFPKITFASLTSGDFFDGFNSWYSDSYPGREGIISLNSKFQSYYGIKSTKDDTVKIHGEVQKGDDIPDEYDPNVTVTEPPTEEKYDKIDAEGDSQSIGAVFVVGNRAFEYYNFSQPQANRYISSMNTLAEKLSGKAKVYDMIVPTSIGITLPDDYMGNINSSDQGKAIDYINSGLSDNIIQVPIFKTLMSHRSEYIYFNTDHHWTQLGAYYSYCEFANIAGIAANSLDKYEKVEFDGFLGTFYNDTGKIPELKSNPDTIYAYKPNSSANMFYIDSNGQKHSWPIVNDVTKYPAAVKYSCFIAGDNPYTEIKNPQITDGSSIMIVKESFANSLVPFLVENYETIYIIDYRHYKGSISEVVLEKNIDTVLYINNVSAIRNENLMNKLEATL